MSIVGVEIREDWFTTEGRATVCHDQTGIWHQLRIPIPYNIWEMTYEEAAKTWHTILTDTDRLVNHA